MSGPRLDGDTWRCQHGWLARVLQATTSPSGQPIAAHLEFRRTTVVLYELWDPVAREASGLIEEISKVRNRAELNLSEIALVEPVDSITYIMCKRCGTDSITTVAAPPSYWEKWAAAWLDREAGADRDGPPGA